MEEIYVQLLNQANKYSDIYLIEKAIKLNCYYYYNYNFFIGYAHINYFYYSNKCISPILY